MLCKVGTAPQVTYFGQVHLWEVVESHPRSFMAIQFQTILIVKESGLSDARTM